MPFDAPAQSGDVLKPADIQNHILAVAPVEYIAHLPNVNTKPGELSPAIRVNVADFSALDESGNPAVYSGALWFNQMLHSNLKRQLGTFVLGQMVTGQATPGRNAPFQLAPVTDPSWQSHCGNWLDNTEQGKQFQEDAKRDMQMAANAAQVTEVAQSAPAAAPSQGPPPAWATAPQTPPAPATSFTAPAAPAAPPAPAAPTATPQAAPSSSVDLSGVPEGLRALIAGMPPEQQAQAIAVARAQAQASS